MKLFEEYEDVKSKIFDYFGYVEDWRILPLVFDTEMYWKIEDGSVIFGEYLEDVTDSDSGDCYSNEIYTNRHLPKHVYRGEDYTMIVVDTHCDGNQFLQVFNNALEVV